MILPHDIQVNFTVRAKTEQEAENILSNFLKYASLTVSNPDIVDYEFVEFIPTMEAPD